MDERPVPFGASWIYRACVALSLSSPVTLTLTWPRCDCRTTNEELSPGYTGVLPTGNSNKAAV